MKKFRIEWETDYCDCFPERTGERIIEAASEEEAVKKFRERGMHRPIISSIEEIM